MVGFRSALLATALLGAFDAAAADYVEATAGDLSNLHGNPTPLTLSVGDNVIDGNHGAGDRDYIAITLPAGATLEAIIVEPGTTFAGTRSFIGVQAGPTMTVDPEDPDVTQLLGYAHFDFGSIGNDILGEIGAGGGAITFTPPLGTRAERTYTFWIQETGGTVAHYRLTFRTQRSAAVPTFGAFGALGAAALAGLLLAIGVRARAPT